MDVAKTPPVQAGSAHRGFGYSRTGLRIVSTAAMQFWRDNVMGMAGMIAFFAFLALIPLALLFLAFVGDLMGGMVTAHQMQQLFHNFMPGLSRQQFLTTYWYPIRHSRVATTVLGVISLPLGTMGLHDSVDWALNRIWGSSQSRPFWIAKLRGLGVTLWVVVFAIASLSASWAWGEMLQVLHVPHALDLGWTGILPIYALDVCLFTALYILTPTCKVDRTGAVVAAASAAAMWGLTKLGFAWWVLQVGTYNRVYGPLAASVIVMLWIWLSGIIFLFGAELAVAIQRRDRPLTDSSVAQGA